MTKSARFSIIVGGLGLLTLLLVGVVVAFSLMLTSQDVRNQASVKNGVVVVALQNETRLTNDTSVLVDQPVAFNLTVNTSGAAIDAIQLKGSVTGVEISDLAFTPAPDARDLSLSVNKVTGNQIELVFTLASASDPFVSASNVSIGRLTMVPKQAGRLQVGWDNVLSKATLYKRAVDNLKAINAVTLPVIGGSGGGSPTIQPSASPTSDIQKSCEVSGGVWRQFGNSCGDSCGVGPDVMCAQVLTYGCDCGANACWNGQTCGPTTPQPSSPTKPTPDPYECVPRPSCLDFSAPCRMAEPAAGWCPRPTNRPSPTVQPSATPTATPTATGCVRAGCSGQLCVPAGQGGLTTTCEFRPEYACYQQAACEMQANGRCGFTDTPQLQACLANGGTTPGTPGPTTPPNISDYDMNGDGKLNLLDLTLFIQYLRDANSKADLNKDNRVNILDYSLFIQQLGGSSSLTSNNRGAQ